MQPLDTEATLRLIRIGLEEDFAHGPDATTEATIDADAVLTTHVVPRQPGVVAGLDVIAWIMQELSLIHISEPTRHFKRSRMPSSA